MTNKRLDNLFKGAGKSQFDFAKQMRNVPTKAEEIMWQQLAGKKIQGYKFRRQHPISNFILDFYCHALKLGIEIDGDIHNETTQAEYDVERTKLLSGLKIEIIRFANDEVLNEIANVLNCIEVKIKELQKTNATE